MSKKQKRKNNKKLIYIIFALILLIITYGIIHFTYSYTAYKITFYRWEGDNVMKTCYADGEGKLNSECVSTVSDICKKWATTARQSSGGTAASEFGNMTFTEDKNYYCVSGTSTGGSGGYTEYPYCYVCKSDSNIMKWTNDGGDADSKCSAGYTKDSSKTESECAGQYCYVCATNSNIMKWATLGIPDENCSEGYVARTDITQENCPPSTACYVCKSDNNIMKWTTSADPDNNCALGYEKDTTKDQSTCVTKNQEIEEGPKTGSVLIYIVWLIGVGTLSYSAYYFNKLRKN